MTVKRARQSLVIFLAHCSQSSHKRRDDQWQLIADPQRTQAQPTGHQANIMRFPEQDIET